MLQNSANIIRGSVTISHGANIAGASRQDTTAAFNGAAIGDKPMCTPAVVNASASIVTVESPLVTTAGIITVSVANLSSATAAAGPAVVYSVSLIKATGEDNVP